MESIDDTLLETEDKMEKAVTFLQEELAGLRTGKASPSLVENVTVDYYGAATRLKELSSIATPEPRLIVINPFDPSALSGIEKALIAANLGMTPMNDGKVIRVPIPELSEERRRELTKVAKRMAEDQRVAIRNIRREANDQIKALQKNGKATEDERDSAMGEVQKATDDAVGNVDASLASREAEIMEV